MSVATPIDVAVNPNNADQRYILWSNGRIDALGGAPAITDSTTWYTRFEPPGVAIHITNWTTGAGWVLDYRGGFNPINGATHANVTDTVMSGVPISASPRVRLYVDWSWDPAGTGQGYVLDGYGRVLPFGGATAPPRTGHRWTSSQAKRFAMQWTPSKKAITVDKYGKLYTDFAATAGAVNASLGKPKFDAVRDFVVMDWTVGSGYILDLYGGMHEFGGRTRPYGWPYKNGGDLARTLAVTSADNPEAFWQVWAGGQSYDYVSSTPPTVIAGGVDPVSPAATVTDSTRPDLLWEYSDPQGDQQAAWQVLVFTQAWVSGHSMTNPLTWVDDALVALEGVDRTARGVACPVDLANGTYRLYVRAKDTAGQWSAWDDHAWTQNITPPATPTGLTATENQSTFRVALSVSTSAGSADLVRFLRSEDGGTTWGLVRGAEAVPRSTVTTATDYDAPLGVTCTYAAEVYAVDPRVTSAKSNTDTATLTTKTYVITAVDDPALGGRLKVQEPVAWSRPVASGVFQGVGTEYPTIVSDGRPKSKRSTVHVYSDDVTDWGLIEGLAESDSVLVYRDPFGSVRYCRLVEDWSAGLYPGAATQHRHTATLPLVEVKPPIAAG